MYDNHIKYQVTLFMALRNNSQCHHLPSLGILNNGFPDIFTTQLYVLYSYETCGNFLVVNSYDPSKFSRSFDTFTNSDDCE